jgi:pimeloyl-ACP methyl ester carboxylesterase
VREIIYFTHGNGFPALCYTQLLAQLGKKYDYCYIDRMGHNPRFPVTENWYLLVKEVVESIQLKCNQPVIALGHSLGGLINLLAAIEKPSLFKAVLMIDSPLFGRFKSGVVRIAKAIGIIDRVTPAFRTRNRREYWQNKEQVINYLKTKTLFSCFTPECLKDYIDHGLSRTNEGYTLRFDRYIEYLIFRTIPHTLHENLGRLAIPAVHIYGNRSTVVNRLNARYMTKHYNISSVEMDGTHMLPFESPVQLANQICTVLDAILK